jgi:hypothetical protein
MNMWALEIVRVETASLFSSHFDYVEGRPASSFRTEDSQFVIDREK